MMTTTPTTRWRARRWRAVLLLVMLVAFASVVEGVTPAQKRKKRASQSNSLDREIAAKRAECLENVRATWDGCESADDPSVLENCVLRCSSAACYAKVYGDDALEEGEVDIERGRAFRTCSRDEMRHLRGYQTFGTS